MLNGLVLKGGLLHRHQDDLQYFLGILTLRNWAHLREIMTRYQEAHGQSIKKLISNQEFQSEEQEAINAIGNELSSRLNNYRI